MAKLIDTDACLRLGNAFMCVFFTLAAYVQLNDPDATVWFATYFVPAVVCFSEASQPRRFQQHTKLRQAAIGVGLLLAAPLMAVSVWGWLRDTQCRGANPLVCEYGRETLGSAIVLSWLFVVSGRTAKPSPSRVWLYVLLSLAPMGLWAGLLLGDAIAYFCVPLT
uniref:Putative transmembrane protein n=1 Tax=Ixodes ricinus TaxID=34613 RepID=A0A147BLV8_IXORI